jgi:hypothetical protein
MELVRQGRITPQRAVAPLNYLLDSDMRKSLATHLLLDMQSGHDRTKELTALGMANKVAAGGKSTGGALGGALGVPTHVVENLGSDIKNTVTGMIPGIGMAAASIGKDIAANTKYSLGLKGGRAGGQQTMKNIIDPLLKSYAQTYGPAFHGDFAETGRRLEAHPLQPILDALTVASAGIGGAARGAAALDAVRAGRVADVAGEAGNAVDVGGRFTVRQSRQPMGGLGDTPHPVTGEPLRAYTKPPPSEFMTNQDAFHPRGFYNTETKQVIAGPIGASHDDILRSMAANGKPIPQDIASGFNPTGAWKPYTAAINPDTGRITNVNLWEDLRGAGGLEKGGLSKADETALKMKVNKQYYTPDQIADNPLYSVHDANGNAIRVNLPSQEAAVHTAQSLISPWSGKPLTAFAKGGGSRGQLWSRAMEAKGTTYADEENAIIKELEPILADTKYSTQPRGVGGALSDVKQAFKEAPARIKEDIKATRAKAVAKAATRGQEEAAHFGPTMARATGAGGAALREFSDGVRAGAIYMHPAYIPNNWAGNAFMSAAHQGVLAPVNLAKAAMIDKYIGERYVVGMDKVMGETPMQALGTGGRSSGYVNAITGPLARFMGRAADVPFRRAAFIHEARRLGYSKMGDIQNLFDRAQQGDRAALQDIATAGRKAQEEIVKFGHMNAQERAIISRMIFVYSWMKGAGRYGARFPLQHPIQSGIFSNLGQQVGMPYVNRVMGGMPSFMAGSIPVGHDSKGNPIMINPFSLNPLGTALQAGEAIPGTLAALKGGGAFNRFAQTDIASMTNPLIQNYLNARSGGKGIVESMKQVIAPLRLYHDLRHPGSGSIYPTSRSEALGHYIVGAMYPREADQVAVTKALEREGQSNPIARIPTDMKTFKQLTGEDIPQELVTPYKHDLAEISREKSFKDDYASSHGQSGFRNLPPANKVDAALKYLAKGFVSPQDLQQLKDGASQLKSDADLNSYANSLWSMTGSGQYKSLWDQMMRDARGRRVSRMRQ